MKYQCSYPTCKNKWHRTKKCPNSLTTKTIASASIFSNTATSIQTYYNSVSPYGMLELEYESTYDCVRNDCGSLHGDFCRCGTIHPSDVTVESINIESIAEYIIKAANKTPNETMVWAISSALMRQRENPLSLILECEPNIVSGYYGEELDSVDVTLQIEDEIQQEIVQYLNTGKEIEIFKNLMIAEHGYLSPRIEKASKIAAKTVQIKHLINMTEPNEERVETLKMAGTKYNKVSGIVYKAGRAKYEIVDGHHRIATSKDHLYKKEEIRVLEIS